MDQRPEVCHNVLGLRIKHLHTKFPWIQERVRDGDFGATKVDTTQNQADVATKPVAGPPFQKHCRAVFLMFPATK